MEASRNVRIAASNSKKELLLQRRADAKMIKMEATQVLIDADDRRCDVASDRLLST